MRTEFVTKGFSKTEAMDSFIQDEALESVSRLLKREKDVHLRLVVDEDSHRNQSRKPHFVCEITVKSAASQGFIKVRKQAHDFRKAVRQATKALKQVLKRRSEKRHDRKQIDQRPFQESGWAWVNPRWNSVA